MQKKIIVANKKMIIIEYLNTTNTSFACKFSYLFKITMKIVSNKELTFLIYKEYILLLLLKVTFPIV